MSSCESLPAPVHPLTEYEALVAAAPAALDAIPGAVYLCDRDGWLVRYNTEAAELWGRKPRLDEAKERFCGSHRLYHPDGTPLPHADCPMAEAVRLGTAIRNAEVVIERPDGSRFVALVNICALKDEQGNIQGAINCFQDITARKRTEAELLRKNQDLEDFFENSAIGLHIVSGEGTILRANKAELALLGYTAEEYAGRHIAEFHVDPPVISDILDRLSCGDRLDRYPARLRAKDDSIKHVLITSNGRFDNGKVVNTRCFTTDVTDLRTVEIARRESEERLAATYEAATVGIAEVDEAGRFVRVNDALCKFLGRSRDQALATSLVDITHEDDRAQDAALYARQVRGELASYAIRKRVLKPDGSIVHLDVSSSSVRDEGGRFRHGVRVIQDVTERERMQEEIQANERRMRELLEALPAAIYTTDPEGRITFFNQAAVELAGRKPELGSDKWCVSWRLYWPDGTPLPHDGCPMAIALKEGRPVRGYEAIAERPDGSRVPFIPYPTPLYDPEGRLVGAVNMLIDITARKDAELRQKVLIDELNHRVKNTLATIQSLAVYTARHARDLGDFSKTFQARVIALAKAHDLLTKHHWMGTALQSLVQDIVAPFADGSQRARIQGDAIDLKPRAAISITMALHELATNAAKYGALSTTGGTLLISWKVYNGPEPALEIGWQEQGGPPVAAPRRRGFGTRLIERCIEQDLAGQADLQFAAPGFRCRIRIPLSHEVRHG
jgi:PAS domain S-box-containing protein